MDLTKIKIINICDKIIIFSLYAIAFFLPISKAIIESFSILAIALYIIKKFIQPKWVPNTKVNFAIFAYLLICFFSIFISSNLKISMRTFFCKTLQDIAFFFVVVETLNTKKRIQIFLWILLISATLLGTDGIYQYFTHKDFLRHRPAAFTTRIYASFHTPNDYAGYLITVIPFALVSPFFKFHFNKTIKFLLTGLFILLLSCLILTFSRGAWLGFMVAALFLSLWLRPIGIAILFFLLFVIAIQPFYPQFIKERLNQTFFSFDIKNLIDPGAMERKIIWRTGWNMFMSKPWVGVGLGTFMFNYQKFLMENYPYGPFYAHNCYLQMAAEIGIIGLTLFLLIIILFFYYGIKTLINHHQKTFLWYVLLASLSSIIGYCVQMNVDTNLYSLDLGMLFWLVLGLGVAIMTNINRLEVIDSK